MASARGQRVFWANVAVGSAGAKSPFVYVGPLTNVMVHLSVNGATTIGFETARPATTSGYAPSGANALPPTGDARVLYKRDGSGALTVVFAGAGTASIDLSPFAGSWLRLSSSNNVTVDAYAEIVG